LTAFLVQDRLPRESRWARISKAFAAGATVTAEAEGIGRTLHPEKRTRRNAGS
jgi:hypothetical protein